MKSKFRNKHTHHFLLVAVFLVLLLPALCSASQTFKQNNAVDLKIQCIINGTYCSSSAFCNTTISYPNGNLLINNKLMTNQISYHNYTLPNTATLGEYLCSVTCCEGTQCGTNDCDYSITPTGFNNTLGFYFIILIISGVIIGFGFLIKDAWITILGTFGLYFIGVYTLINGIVGIKDMITTWALGLVILGIAGYISINSAIEVVQEYL